mmetsp:Transcript_44702/g.83886  ORF Transcript_44702/g.83886 Transcript_44702/m.83886 type:complete len:223 (-) Transcript_44702:3765-4433(-)
MAVLDNPGSVSSDKVIAAGLLPREPLVIMEGLRVGVIVPLRLVVLALSVNDGAEECLVITGDIVIALSLFARLCKIPMLELLLLRESLVAFIVELIRKTLSPAPVPLASTSRTSSSAKDASECPCTGGFLRRPLHCAAEKRSPVFLLDNGGRYGTPLRVTLGELKSESSLQKLELLEKLVKRTDLPSAGLLNASEPASLASRSSECPLKGELQNGRTDLVLW